jgi:hypothetical protein
MPRDHSSLLDELQEVAGDEVDALPSLHQSSDAGTGPQPEPCAASSSSLPAHTPLAKYMARLNGDSSLEDEDAHSNRSSDEELKFEAPAEAAPATSAPSRAYSDATSSASAPWRLLSQVAFEIASPCLVATCTPTHTLSHRSKQWCIRVCIDTTKTHAPTTSIAESIQQQSARSQITRQMQQLRRIYLIAIAVALLQLLFFGAQLSMLLLQQLALPFLVRLLLDGVPHEWPTRPSGWTIHWMPMIYAVWCLVAVWNATIAYVSSTVMVQLNRMSEYGIFSHP